MPTLFEISDDLLALEEILEELGGEITDEDVERCLDGWFQQINFNLKNKVDNYCALIKQLEANAKKRKALAAIAKEEYERLAALRDRDEKSARRLKERLLEFFTLHKITVMETERFRPSVQANGGLLPLVMLRDEDKLPDEFTKITREKNADVIREALDAGEQLDFACYGERGKHLRIR